MALAQTLPFTEKDEQDQQQIVAAVKGWLLVMDNANEMLPDEGAKSLAQDARRGQINDPTTAIRISANG